MSDLIIFLVRQEFFLISIRVACASIHGTSLTCEFALLSTLFARCDAARVNLLREVRLRLKFFTSYLDWRNTVPDESDPSASSIQRDCTVPPAIPHAMLPGLMFARDRESERLIREYVEWQAPNEHMVHAERVTTEVVLGRKMEAWDVHTQSGRWWVITSPMNLYAQELFPSLDYAISFHVGVTTRMMSRPDPGVPKSEQSILAVAWRKWEQAAESLDEAEEAEDFQAVGMRCRECFVAKVKAAAVPEMIPEGSLSPKRSDVVAWCELVANSVAHGASAQHVRTYLKITSKAGWQMVNWLTHTSGATFADAVFAIEVTQHVLGVFGTALFREKAGVPDRCEHCGSYRLGIWSAEKDGERKESIRCQSCGGDRQAPFGFQSDQQ